MEDDYEVRAQTGGAMLAHHLCACMWAVANDKPFPEFDDIPWTDGDGVEADVMTVCALLGMNPDTTRNKMRVVRLFQALAEMLAAQGAAIECELANVIHNEHRQAMVFKISDEPTEDRKGMLPPCSRHELGENDRRVRATVAAVFVRAELSDSIDDIDGKIARVHDHQGLLVVACYEPLPDHAETWFRQAWQSVGEQAQEAVFFVEADSPDWESFWARRGFDSAWQP